MNSEGAGKVMWKGKEYDYSVMQADRETYDLLFNRRLPYPRLAQYKESNIYNGSTLRLNFFKKKWRFIFALGLLTSFPIPISELFFEYHFSFCCLFLVPSVGV